MAGKYITRKTRMHIDKIKSVLNKITSAVRRAFLKTVIKNRDFSVISNNCWAGRVYQYLDMPYLSPTAGLYFFAPDYIKFVSDLRRYLATPLRFIKPEESKYYEEIKKKKHTDKPIGIIDDVEIVFLHYKTKEEAEEKWNRRKERVNYNNIILKFSRMNLCTDKEIDEFCNIPFENKFVFNTRKKNLYPCEIFWRGKIKDNEVLNDTIPFPNRIKLKCLLSQKPVAYPYKIRKTGVDLQ